MCICVPERRVYLFALGGSGKVSVTMASSFLATTAPFVFPTRTFQRTSEREFPERQRGKIRASQCRFEHGGGVEGTPGIAPPDLADVQHSRSQFVCEGDQN